MIDVSQLASSVRRHPWRGIALAIVAGGTTALAERRGEPLFGGVLRAIAGELITAIGAGNSLVLKRTNN
ncbi:MAG TPA: hypothetical protein VFQ53_12505 [Kofleriaceae bacterium]|nr:hypothetical protein [Kofleriaceae bacterium]